MFNTIQNNLTDNGWNLVLMVMLVTLFNSPVLSLIIKHSGRFMHRVTRVSTDNYDQSTVIEFPFIFRICMIIPISVVLLSWYMVLNETPRLTTCDARNIMDVKKIRIQQKYCVYSSIMNKTTNIYISCHVIRSIINNALTVYTTDNGISFDFSVFTIDSGDDSLDLVASKDLLHT